MISIARDAATGARSTSDVIELRETAPAQSRTLKQSSMLVTNRAFGIPHDPYKITLHM